MKDVFTIHQADNGIMLKSDEYVEVMEDTHNQIALCVRIAWKECGNFDKWCYLADLLPKGGDK